MTVAASLDEIVLHHARDGLGLLAGGRLVVANPALRALVGHLDAPAAPFAALRPGGEPVRLELPGRDGTDPVPVLAAVDAATGPDGEPALVLCVRRPTGLLAQAVALAEEDALTGLLNRRGFEARARQLLAAPGRGASSAAVAEVAVALAVRLGWDARRQARLHQAARLHDVGKAAVPVGVLRHPGALDAAQLAQVHQHPAVGAAMVAGALDAEQASWVRDHHEWWDGRGYPGGTRGDALPVGAQLLAVADAFEAMTNERPYAPARTVEAALAEVGAFAGRAFRPDAAELLADALAWLARGDG